MYFGVQMYGVSKEWKQDPEGFLKKIYEAGYRQIEPCLGFRVDARDYGFWIPEDLEQAMPLLAKYHIEVHTVHIFLDEYHYERELAILTELAQKYHISWFVVKSPERLTKDVLDETAARYRELAEELEKAGAGLLIHNEKEDICIRVNGKTAYEYLLEACGEKVGAEVDAGWMYCGGVDPEEFLWAHADRVKAVHYKDMKITGQEAPLGKGMVDLKACFQFARANGALQIVDMDAATLEDTCRAGKMLSGWTGDRDNTDSILCTMDVETGEETVLHEFPGIIEAPNWLNDGNTLLYNADGKIYRYEIDKDHVEQVDTGFCVQCNNDHVPSPDNQLLAVSCMPPELTDGTYESHIYVLPMTGGEPKDLTGPGLSYLHGWSPDGKELAYCAFRKKPEEETMRIEICTIPSDGGEETCLTDGKGYNDGPEYSPDGKHIWFNSTRSGLMQVWRMNRDGSGLTQMTDSDANNWFGHVSPDGKHVIYLTFAKGELEPNEHLPNMYVSLGMMDYDGQNKKKLLDLFGGQGSINVNSWAPDSRRIAYVKYVLHHK
ncbi:MAG TPA: TIM barrel protein [Fusicatenibacter saccharivorans]|uniref:TIM barrel protein n=1 Tax=Blautia sp. AM29-29 TaxID=2292975 RepID=UPI001313ED3D|nr:TIM barrel protein [Blautia sp. AM29-29]HJH89388.1 TIM barrel protein [Fusicatenibacter saccharivorans]